MKKIIAVDFDGTICEDSWPDIGAPRQRVITALKARQAQGDVLILWTCREGLLLEQALNFCDRLGLKFAAVNDNPPERVAIYGYNSRKIGADEYWDDRAVTPGQLLSGRYPDKPHFAVNCN